jgi:hypothetical protein
LAGVMLMTAVAAVEGEPVGKLEFAERFLGEDAATQCQEAANLEGYEEGYEFAFNLKGPPQALTYPVSDMGGPLVDEDNGQLLESITFSDTTTKEFRWETEGAPIDAVIVKGGPGANIYFYDPQAFGDGLLQSPLNRGRRQADVSSVTFCWNPLKCDDPAPDISRFAVVGNTWENPEIVLTWVTAHPATSLVKIRNVATEEEFFSGLDPALKTEHAVSIEGLTRDTEYVVTAISTSCSGLTSASNELILIPDCTQPAPQISIFSLRDLTRESVVITWWTDRPATSRVKIKNVATEDEFFSDLDPALKTEHAVSIEGLQPDTLYTVTAISISCSGLETATNGLSFRTRR